MYMSKCLFPHFYLTVIISKIQFKSLFSKKQVSNQYLRESCQWRIYTTRGLVGSTGTVIPWWHGHWGLLPYGVSNVGLSRCEHTCCSYQTFISRFTCQACMGLLSPHSAGHSRRTRLSNFGKKKSSCINAVEVSRIFFREYDYVNEYLFPP